MAVIKKILVAILTILIAVVVMFVVIEYMPGNPVEIMASDIMKRENIEYTIAYERAKALLNYDPDIPLWERFTTYIQSIAKGELGQSIAYKKPVSEIVGEALPWTLLVVSLSLFLSFVVGVLIGIVVAWKRSRVLDAIVIAWQSIVGAIPNYILAYILVIIFAVRLGWLPSRGPYSTSVEVGWNFHFIGDVFKHAILPVMAYFFTTVANWVMSMRASCLAVLGEDYMNYAVVRGLSERRIITHYISRNAILPLITSLAVSFGLLFGGSPLIENLFLYPGVGYYLNRAIARRDFPLMQGMFLIIIVMVVLSSLVAEYMYKWLNPRLREG